MTPRAVREIIASDGRGTGMKKSRDRNLGVGGLEPAKVPGATGRIVVALNSPGYAGSASRLP